jgi:GTP-binding protein HflX
VFISAKTGIGIDAFVDRIAKEFADRWTEVDLLVPYTEAGILSELYDAGAPVVRRDEADGIHATAHLPARLVGRVERWRVQPEQVEQS